MDKRSRVGINDDISGVGGTIYMDSDEEEEEYEGGGGGVLDVYREPEALGSFNGMGVGFSELGVGNVKDFTNNGFSDYKRAYKKKGDLATVEKIKPRKFEQILLEPEVVRIVRL